MQSNLHHLSSAITPKKIEKTSTDFNRSNTPMQTTKTPHRYSTWNTTPVGLLLLKHPKLHSKLQKRYLLTDNPANSASAKFHNSKVSQSRDRSKKFKEVVPVFLRHLNCIHWQPTLDTQEDQTLGLDPSRQFAACYKRPQV
jgi:hypothetical protein